MMRLLFLMALVFAACPIAGALTLSADPTAAPTADTIALPIAAPADTATPGAQTADTCRVIAHALNVRSCPGLDCEAVQWLKAGDIVTIIGRSDGWIKLPTGYIREGYCEVK